MLTAFIVILGLQGEPIFAGHSTQTFATMEECDAFNKSGGAAMAERLDAIGKPFSEIRLKCAPDTQSEADVMSMFGLTPPTSVPVPPPQ